VKGGESTENIVREVRQEGRKKIDLEKMGNTRLVDCASYDKYVYA
jgi:hypothetical protein